MLKKWFLGILVLALLGTFSLAVIAQDEAEDAAYPWWNERVFYEIFVRSFYDSDGDGIGDFQGIIEKLDYLNDGDPNTTDDLGVTGIWLMPVNPSPSYHGYDVTDYYTVNPDYGTLADFKELIALAHERDIAVIVDLVVNHTSSQHPWFIESSTGEGDYADWYIWAEENPGYAGPWGAPAWHEKGGRYYYGVFWSEMPDLNFTTPAVIDEMYNIAEFWLDTLDVDGFRLDAAKHIIEDGEIQENTPATREWWVNFQSFIQSVNPNVFTVGELFNVPSFIAVNYINDGSFSVTFDFDLSAAMLSSVINKNKRNISRAHERGLKDYPPGQFAVFLANHDQPRVMTSLRDEQAARVAATLLLTSPGVPFMYYGEEIGMVGGKPDERIRTPMQWTDEPVIAGFTSADEPWEPLQEELSRANIATQDENPDSLLNHYRALIHLRNQTAALQTGDLTVIDSSFRSVYAYLRHTDDEVVLVLVNMDDEPVTDYTIELEEGPLVTVSGVDWLYGAGDFALPVVNDEGGFDAFTPLPELGAYSTVIVRLTG